MTGAFTGNRPWGIGTGSSTGHLSREPRYPTLANSSRSGARAASACERCLQWARSSSTACRRACPSPCGVSHGHPRRESLSTLWKLLEGFLPTTSPSRGGRRKGEGEKSSCERGFIERSYWIPGSYASALSEQRNTLLRLLKNKSFKEQSMSKARLYTIDTSTTLESNKSLKRS